MGILFGKAKEKLGSQAVNMPRLDKEHSHYQLYCPATGQSWRLRYGDSMMGRSLDNDIVLADDSVSRHHASVHVDPKSASVFIEDLNSANGLNIGGRRVKRAILPRDVLFSLGSVGLVLRKPSAFESGQAHFLRD